MASKALEDLENEVNRKINSENDMMDRIAEQSGTKDAAKAKELAKRLATHNAHMQRRASDAGLSDEAAPGQASGTRGDSTATPSDVLSSPYAGATPRYVPQAAIDPDPLAEAAPRPESEADGRTGHDDPPMDRPREQMQAQAQRQVPRQDQPASAPQRPAAANDNKDDKKK